MPSDSEPRTEAGRHVLSFFVPGTNAYNDVRTGFIRAEAEAARLALEDVAERDLNDDEEDRLADVLRRADYMNWTAAELAPLLSGTVRAILARRAAVALNREVLALLSTKEEGS